MGYTHYWYINNKEGKLDKTKFKLLSYIVKNMAKTSNGEIAGCNGKGNPIISNSKIIFNGKYPEYCETFTLRSKVYKHQLFLKEENKYFECCKTNSYSYDKYVVAVLLLAKAIFGKEISISTDSQNSKDLFDGYDIAVKYIDCIDINWFYER